jgi:hypothetical protein
MTMPGTGAAKSVPPGLTEITSSPVGVPLRPSTCRVDVMLLSLALPPGPVTVKVVVRTKLPLTGSAAVKTRDRLRCRFELARQLLWRTAGPYLGTGAFDRLCQSQQHGIRASPAD